MALRTRLALLFVVAVAALVVLGGVLLMDQLDARLDAALDVSLTARADALAQQVGSDGNVRDFQDGSGGSAPLAASQTLAQVISPTGAVLESSEGAGSQPLLSAEQLRATRAGVVAVSSTLPTGTRVRLLALPVAESGGSPTIVVVGTSREIAVAAADRVLLVLWVGGPAAVLLGALGAWLVAGAVLRPVQRMRMQAAAISAADSGARLAVPRRRDEIALLGATFNDLLGRLQRALSQQRAFVADAGHELRTPLTMLRAELELAARPGRDRRSLQAAVRAAATDTDRLIRLAEDLLALARAEGRYDLAREPVRLDELVTDAVKAAAPVAEGKRVVLDVVLAVRVTVAGDADRLRQVIDNLVDNAVRYAPEGSTVAVTVRVGVAGEVVLEVFDEGPGFPADFLPRAFDRFARAEAGRTDGTGTGLGLAIVAAIVDAHGGTVSADNRPAGGAVVRVELLRGEPAGTDEVSPQM
jgi:hypothetical protein